MMVSEDIKTKLLMRDLKEGDVAIIEYQSENHVVFIYKKTDLDETLYAVSLSTKCMHWDNVKTNPIIVLRVLRKGDILKVVE